jgi:hypothetical protein
MNTTRTPEEKVKSEEQNKLEREAAKAKVAEVKEEEVKSV